MKAFLVLGFIALAGFSAKLIWDAGYFYRGTNHGLADCAPLAEIPGPEDMAYSPSLAQVLVSSDLRAANENRGPDGKIFAINATGQVEAVAHKIPGPFHPHGLDVLSEGGKDFIFVVNHRGESESVVELLEARAGKLQYIRRFANPALLTPNDVLATTPDSFYVTQDHGSKSHLAQTIEHFTRVARGSLGYFSGDQFTTLVGGIGFANGLALDRKRNLLYVAAMTEKAVRVYQIGSRPELLTLVRRIGLNAGPDNLSLDADGSLWIGAHPNFFALKRHSENHAAAAPSQILRVVQPWSDQYEVREWMADDGGRLRAASVAAPAFGKIFLGGIYEPKVLSCPQPLPDGSPAPPR